jgi:hypothetical protein
MKARGKPFEILFLISDKSMYKAYSDAMPWAGIICSGPKRSALTKEFGIASV